MGDKKLNNAFRLFSGRKRLTIQEKERILEAVMAARTHPHKRTFSGTVRLPLFARVALATCALLLLIPAIVLLGRNPSDEGAFTAKGDGAKPFIVPRCLGENRDNTCRRGDTLTFRVRSPRNKAYLSMFAKHRQSGDVIWYFPSTEAGQSVALKNEGAAVLDVGVAIGGEHVQGEYDVYGVFSTTALGRQDTRSLFEQKGQTDNRNCEIIKTRLTVL